MIQGKQTLLKTRLPVGGHFFNETEAESQPRPCPPSSKPLCLPETRPSKALSRPSPAACR